MGKICVILARMHTKAQYARVKKKQKIIVIVGPTASGKSALAVELAQKFDGEIISADSRQVYRGLNIGTGKVTKTEMRGVPHHLLDVASPKRAFTAYDFALMARNICSNILQNDKIPIIAGGTGFYIDVLLGRTSLPDVPPDKRLRARLEKKTAAQLLAQLKRLSPKRAKALVKKNEQNNKRRLIRAIEIAGSKSKAKFLDLPMMDLRSPSFEVLWVGVTPGPEKLRKRIHARLIARMRRGMVAEARQLHEKGLSWKRMEELGLEYRYLARYLRGYTSKNEMVEQIEAKIWQYSRRQMTYWKRNKNIQWFKPSEEKRIKKAVKDFLAD